MKFFLDGIWVYFPYAYIYPEQYQYMYQLKKALDANGSCALEMPTGTGKTISLLSLVMSWILAHRTPENPYKLIYCCRTIGEVDKTLEELRRLWNYIVNTIMANNPDIPQVDTKELQQQQAQAPQYLSAFLALSLSSRKSLCINPAANSLGTRVAIDAKCHDLTSPEMRELWRSKHGGRWYTQQPESDRMDVDMEGDIATSASASARAAQDSLCQYYENFMSATGGASLLGGGDRARRSTTMIDIEDTMAANEPPPPGPQQEGGDGATPWSDTETPLHAIRGIFSLDELSALGKARGVCPYFLARYLLPKADVVVYSYQYLLNPRIHQVVSQQLRGDAIVIFDEAHNIDNVCIEALSVRLNKTLVESATRNVRSLSTRLGQLKQQDVERLNNEYRSLLRGLNLAAPAGGPPQQQQRAPDAANTNAATGGGGVDAPLAIPRDPSVAVNPVLPDDVVNEAIPENIRKASEYVQLLEKFTQYLKGRLGLRQVIQETPAAFLRRFADIAQLPDAKILKFFTARLGSLLRTLQVTQQDKFAPLALVCDFATLASTYETEGFTVLLEPYEPYELALAAAAAARHQQQQQGAGASTVAASQMEFSNPRLELACLDACLAMKAVVKKFPRVVITSGTLSPPGLLPRIIGMIPAVTLSLGMTLQRPSVCPLVVARGSDQGQVSTKFDMRNNLDVSRNYGLLLLEFASIVPDGIVCFFPSYQFMEMMVSVWNEMGILHRLVKHKLLFVETEDLTETSLALHSYKKACDAGRGAVFFSVARGKVSEGIDFDNHYGRCVILFGVPFVYTESRVLKARLQFLRAKFQIHETEFLAFDAMRMASQCVGRVVRGKSDYGIMVFADKRYNRIDKRSKLPQWITQFMSPSHLNLSTDTAASMARSFLKEMGQPIDRATQVGVSLWSEHEVSKQPQSQMRGGIGPPPASTTFVPPAHHL